MKTTKRLISVLVVLMIPLLAMLWLMSHESSGLVSIELIGYPLLFGSGSIGLIYLLKKYFLDESIKDFNPGKGSWYSDLVWGAILAGIYFVLFFAFRASLSSILERRPNYDMVGLMLDMATNPLLLIVWFGPVLWIGIALYEELVRVFLLTSIWRINNNISVIILSIALSSLIFGLAHFSQGSYGMVTIGIKSIVPAFFFYHKRRIMPLIYAHVLYDGIQVAMFLITFQSN